MEKGTTKGLMFPIGSFNGCYHLLGLGAEGINDYVRLAAESLLNPNLYIEAVFEGNPMP